MTISLKDPQNPRKISLLKLLSSLLKNRGRSRLRKGKHKKYRNSASSKTYSIVSSLTLKVQVKVAPKKTLMSLKRKQKRNKHLNQRKSRPQLPPKRTHRARRFQNR